MPKVNILEKKYEELGKNYRFFLSWRHASFAAMVIAISTGLSFIFSNFDKGGNELGFIPIIISFGVLAFLMVDIRLRQLYRSLVESGAELEKVMKQDLRKKVSYKGPFESLSESKTYKKKSDDKLFIRKHIFSIDHSATVNWFSIVSIIVLLSVSIYLFYFKEVEVKKPIKIEVSGLNISKPDTLVVDVMNIPNETQDLISKIQNHKLCIVTSC